MGGESIQALMPTFWPISSTHSVYKAAEASTGLSETEWLSSDHIPRWPIDDASGQSQLEQICPTNLPAFWELVNQKMSILTPIQEIDFLGFCVCTTAMRWSIPSKTLRKSMEDAPLGISLGEGNSMICGESNCYNQSYPTNPTALPGPPDANELCPSPELYSGGNFGQV